MDNKFNAYACRCGRVLTPEQNCFCYPPPSKEDEDDWHYTAGNPEYENDLKQFD